MRIAYLRRTRSRAAQNINRPMQVALFHNSGAGKDDISTSDLATLLRRSGFNPVCFPLKESLDDPAALNTGEFVIAAGGDGSVREVALRLAHTGRPLAPLPLGTANNIARSLGLRGSPADIIAGWKSPRRARLDLGVARGPWGETKFIEGVGLGLVGRAISLIESIAKASGHDYDNREDELHRDLSVFLTLAQEMSPIELSLEINGTASRDRFLLLEILNITGAGPALQLASRAEPGDGLLDVVAVPESQRSRLSAHLLQHFSSSRPEPLLSSQNAREVRITTAACDVRIDDCVVLDSRDRSPSSEPFNINISVDHAALELILPAEGA